MKVKREKVLIFICSFVFSHYLSSFVTRSSRYSFTCGLFKSFSEINSNNCSSFEHFRTDFITFVFVSKSKFFNVDRFSRKFTFRFVSFFISSRSFVFLRFKDLQLGILAEVLSTFRSCLNDRNSRVIHISLSALRTLLPILFQNSHALTIIGLELLEDAVQHTTNSYALTKVKLMKQQQQQKTFRNDVFRSLWLN